VLIFSENKQTTGIHFFYLGWNIELFDQLPSLKIKKDQRREVKCYKKFSKLDETSHRFLYVQLALSSHPKLSKCNI